MSNFPHYKQYDAMDCGPSCLRMVAKHYGKQISLDTLRQGSGFSKEGVSLLGISEAAETIGFRASGVKLTYAQLLNDAQLPCILHWSQNHFVVLTPQSRLQKQRGISIADPAKQYVTKISQRDLLQHWLNDIDNEEQLGIALLLEPTPKFNEQEEMKAVN